MKRTNSQNQNDAKIAYLAKLEDLQTRLDELKYQAANLKKRARKAPEEINWADVGDLGRLNMALSEAVEIYAGRSE